MQIRAFAPADTETVVALWEECGLTRPWNDPRRDVERTLRVQPELFLVGTELVEVDGRPEEAVVATAMAGLEGHRGWLHYLAVAPAHRGGGRARARVSPARAAPPRPARAPDRPPATA